VSASSNWLAASAALLGLFSVALTSRAECLALHPASAEPVEAQFRGCDSAGWCRFWIESADPLVLSLYRVRPDGISRTLGDDATRIAVRNRLNALLASMIHQFKRIVLCDLRQLDDGTFTAAVMVNGADVALDPILLELQKKPSKTSR